MYVYTHTTQPLSEECTHTVHEREHILRVYTYSTHKDTYSTDKRIQTYVYTHTTQPLSQGHTHTVHEREHILQERTRTVTFTRVQYPSDTGCVVCVYTYTCVYIRVCIRTRAVRTRTNALRRIQDALTRICNVHIVTYMTVSTENTTTPKSANREPQIPRYLAIKFQIEIWV